MGRAFEQEVVGWLEIQPGIDAPQLGILGGVGQGDGGLQADEDVGVGVLFEESEQLLIGLGEVGV